MQIIPEMAGINLSTG